MIPSIDLSIEGVMLKMSMRNGLVLTPADSQMRDLSRPWRRQEPMILLVLLLPLLMKMYVN
jgi:hypothetical protein